MANEAYRLRSLAYRWEQWAEGACDEYRDYKGRECATCGYDSGAHAYKRCVKELRALLAEPELLVASVPEPTAQVEREQRLVRNERIRQVGVDADAERTEYSDRHEDR